MSEGYLSAAQREVLRLIQGFTAETESAGGWRPAADGREPIACTGMRG